MGKNVPVQKGEQYIVKIENLNHLGEGVGRIDGFAVFTPYVLPGEKVEIKINEVKKNFAIGELQEIIETAPERIMPRCPVFYQCGGCQTQHMTYEAQLNFKTQVVKDAVRRIGKLEAVPVHSAMGMDNPWYYRNKVQMPLGIEAGKVVAGFYAPGTHDIVETDMCYIQHEKLVEITQWLKEKLLEHHISMYNEGTTKGLLRHVLLRIGFNTDEIMMVFITNGRKFPEGQSLALQLQKEFPQIISIMQNINNKRTNVIMGDETLLLAGQDYITEELAGIRYKISPRSFFQVNTKQAEVLFAKALDYAGLTGGETVLDAYCGTGSISLMLAQKAKKVYGIEVIGAAIKDAWENARENGIENVEFIEGKTEEELSRLVKEGIHMDVAVVDPPRKGCDKIVLETFAKMNVPRIVYVSCNPSSLARDLAYLTEMGYEVQEVQPVDMFPATGHVECVVLIERK